MKVLSQMHVVQFSFWEYESFHLRVGGTAFLGPNGAGKTSMVDAAQIAILGGKTKRFNAQVAHRDHRTIRDYALGAMRSDDSDKVVLTRKREDAISYITLVFEGETPAHVVSAGICIHATAREKDHSVLGLYVLPGVRLALDDHLGAIGHGEKAPLEWATFEAQIRRLAKDAGRTPTICAPTGHKAYQAELLHCLQHKGRTIHPEKFVRAFAQSLQLKNIQSVNDYLRGYLVDAEPIDKSGTLAHIKNVRRLNDEIAKVKEQIVQLGTLERRYQNLNSLYQTRQSAYAVQLQFAIEDIDGEIGRQLERKDSLTLALRDARQSEEHKAEEAKMLQQTWTTLFAQFNSDPLAQRPEEMRVLREARKTAANERRKGAERLSLHVRDALDKAASQLATLGDSRADQANAMAVGWMKEHQNGQLPTLSMCEAALEFLGEVAGTLTTAFENDIEQAKRTTAELKIAAERKSAASKGIRISKGHDGVALVMALFRESGIGSTTVASLVRVTDRAWQPAVESYLGGNRYALVVDSGREREAVRIMRTTAKDICNVTVVQPEHLKDMIGRPTEQRSVGSLIEGENRVAVAYLRRCIGRLRQVETEEELERYDRSLTADGMLSLNGGTRRIPILKDPQQWELGAKFAGSEQAELERDLVEALRADDLAKQRLRASRDADEAIRLAIREATSQAFSAALTAYASSTAELQATEAVNGTELPEHLTALQKQIEETRVQGDAAVKEQTRLANMAGKFESDLNNLAVSLRLAQDHLAQLQHQYEAARNDANFSNELAVSIYASLCDAKAAADHNTVKTVLSEKMEAANKAIVKVEPTARTEFHDFINSRSINLVEERSDWRKAWQWTTRHLEKLQKSTLVEYEAHAEEAKIAANKAFRSDVAFKIRDAIKRVQFDIGELNKILTSCPEFTGGEKYKFRADPSPTYAELYKLIEGSAAIDGGTLPLEETSDTAQTQLLELLKACEHGSSRETNPLEDYRLLFNFDLDIYVDGKRVDVLSKRLGVGSNGEHLVPFYVIAGASLANAYGMKAGSEHDGAAIMLIDEAFHGFDAQNTYVTAQFLRSLGLQLIVAAPDADVGKLAPVLDSFYDLNRFGPDVFAFENLVKEPAKQLFMQDIPNQNPALVAHRVEQLRLDT